MYVCINSDLLMVHKLTDTNYSGGGGDHDQHGVDNPNYIEMPGEAVERHVIHTYESADLAHQMQSGGVPGARGTQPSQYGYSEPIDSIAGDAQVHLYTQPLCTNSHGPPDAGHSHWRSSHVGSSQLNGFAYYETPLDGKTGSSQYCTPVDGCNSVIIKGRTYAVLTKTPLQPTNFFQPTSNESEVNVVSYDRLEQL